MQPITKQQLPKYQALQNLADETISLKKEITKKNFQSRLFGRHIFPSPRIKVSNPHSLVLYGVETGVLLPHFAQQLRWRNAEVPDFYFNSPDAAGIFLTLVLSPKANTKGKGNWVLFRK